MSNYEDEARLVQGLLWRLNPEVQNRWQECRSSRRILAYKNKVLVIYEFKGDIPVILDKLTCIDASLSLTEGLTSTWTSTKFPNFTVGQVPIEVFPSVFLWHTFSSELLYSPYKGVYAIKFSLLFKSRHSPKQRNEGAIYIQELGSYSGEFPHAL